MTETSFNQSLSPLSETDLRQVLSTPRLPSITAPFELESVSEETVERVLHSLRSGGISVDGFTSPMLRLASASLVPSLTEIINSFIEDVKFPSLWKRNSIVLLVKKASLTSPSDTRLIVHLPEASKVPERILHDQLLEYLVRNNLLDPHQHAYKKLHSTQTALLSLLNDTRIEINDRMVTLLVSFDFLKAFDTVSHFTLPNSAEMAVLSVRSGGFPATLALARR